MIKLLAIVPLCIALGGCVTAQERAQQARAQFDAIDDQQCRSYGAQPGSDVYVNCRTQLMAARYSAPVVVTGAPAVPAYRDPPPPVTCMRTGTMVTCN